MQNFIKSCAWVEPYINFGQGATPPNTHEAKTDLPGVRGWGHVFLIGLHGENLKKIVLSEITRPRV